VKPERFYRFENVRYTTGVRVHLQEYTLIKETPCGYWIKPVWDYDDYHKKWVSKTARKRFAYPTQEEAITSFMARKRRQIQIIESQLIDARSALSAGSYIEMRLQREKEKEN